MDEVCPDSVEEKLVLCVDRDGMCSWPCQPCKGERPPGRDKRRVRVRSRDRCPTKKVQTKDHLEFFNWKREGEDFGVFDVPLVDGRRPYSASTHLMTLQEVRQRTSQLGRDYRMSARAELIAPLAGFFWSIPRKR